jgi:hypothetical protein
LFFCVIEKYNKARTKKETNEIVPIVEKPRRKREKYKEEERRDL